MLMRIDTHGSKGILSRRNLLLAPLALAACKREVTHQRVDPALAPLIPSDTTTLIGLRVDNLRKTPYWDKLFPATGPSILDNLKLQSGLDLRTGLYEAVYCNGGRHNLALIRGKFVDGGITNAGLEPQLNIPGAAKFPYKGFTFVGQEEQAVTYFNSSVFIAGRASALRYVIDNREQKNAIPRNLLALVETLPPEASIYIASVQPRLPEGGIGGLKAMPVTLTTFKSWLDLRSTATLKAEVVGATPEDARKFHDGLKGLVSIVRMTARDDQKDILAALGTMQLFLEGTTVKLSADLPVDAITRSLGGLDPLTP